MSTKIMALAWPLQLSPTQKAVLISLADNANDEGVCWPSVATICERTCLSRRTVQACINSLVELGYLVSNGRDGRSNVYHIRCAPDARVQDSRLRDRCAPPARQLRTPCATAAPITVSEPSNEPSLNKRAKKAFSLPDWIPRNAWDAWIEYRKARNLSCRDVTQNGHVRLLEKLMRQGNPPDEVIEQSIDQGWQGLFALKNKATASYQQQRDEERARTIEGLTGLKRGSHERQAIDITSTTTVTRAPGVD